MNTDQISGETLWQWWQAACQAEPLGQDSSLVAELNWLLAEVAGLDRLSLRLGDFRGHSKITLSLPLADLNQLWQRRLQERVPIQYLLGVAPWRQFRLKVSPAVLIPRPETEGLIDLAVAAAEQSPIPRKFLEGLWADLGTGSGAIAIGLATAFPLAIIHAVDRSPAALAVAQENIQELDLATRIHLYQGSWLEPLIRLKGKLSGVVANPPYIPTGTLAQLQPEVSWHEPHLALDGGTDGLESLRAIITAAPAYLRPGGVLLLEMMAGQENSVRELLRQGEYTQVKIYPDLAGIERFALAYRRPESSL